MTEKPTGDLQPMSSNVAEVGADRLACQVCGRMLVRRSDGTARAHGRYGRCQGSGYRLAPWPIGQQLRHYAGSVWEVIAREQYDGTSHNWMTEYTMRCLSDPHSSFGRDEQGRERTFHGEYLHRHGWMEADRVASDSSRPSDPTDADRYAVLTEAAQKASGEDMLASLRAAGWELVLIRATPRCRLCDEPITTGRRHKQFCCAEHRMKWNSRRTHRRAAGLPLDDPRDLRTVRRKAA